MFIVTVVGINLMGGKADEIQVGSERTVQILKYVFQYR